MSSQDDERLADPLLLALSSAHEAGVLVRSLRHKGCGLVHAQAVGDRAVDAALAFARVGHPINYKQNKHGTRRARNGTLT